jgi:predicted kinase
VALLVVFAGVPGSGKSVLARDTATALGATYLRIDSIEYAIAATLTPVSGDPEPHVAGIAAELGG